MPQVLIRDRDIARDVIRSRVLQCIDRYDEVWDGVYVVPEPPNLAQQELVHDFSIILASVVSDDDDNVYPGADISDRPKNWNKNYRIPDIVVLLKNSRAKKYDSFILGGPDFLTEIKADDDPEAKIPFYSKIQAQELLIIHRDKRDLKLFRHDGHELVPVEPTALHGSQWLVSTVLPLAFRRIVVKGKPRTEIRRTDSVAGRWTL